MRLSSIPIKRWGMLLLAGALLHVGAAAADTLTFQEGDGGLYSATAATFISPGSSANNGAVSTILTTSFNGVLSSMCFVRFPDIIGGNVGQIPPGSTILSGFLELTRSGGSNVASSAHQVDTAWDEYTVTGTNWTDIAGTDYLPSVGVIPAGSTATGSVNVTTIVQAWAVGAANWGIMLRPATLGSLLIARYSSDDAADPNARPRLTVEFIPSGPVAVAPTTWGRIKSLYR